MSQPFLATSIALLGGYLFVKWSPYRRFRAESMRSDRYALHIAGWSFALYAGSAVLLGLHSNFLLMEDFGTTKLGEGLPAAALVSVILAIPAAWVDSFVLALAHDAGHLSALPRSIPARCRAAAMHKYMERSADAATRTLYRATVQRKRIMVTLKSGKVYVGEPKTTTPEVNETPQTLRIIPFASGYRDPVTKKVTLGTQYMTLAPLLRPDASQKLSDFQVSSRLRPDDPLAASLCTIEGGSGAATVDVEDLGVVLFWREIESLMLFDENIYAAFNPAASSPKIGTQN